MAGGAAASSSGRGYPDSATWYDRAVSSHLEDTGEIVFEDGESPDARSVESLADGMDLGAGRFPRVVQHAGRLFRLRRREIVSRTGEPTHLRVTYTIEKEPRS